MPVVMVRSGPTVSQVLHVGGPGDAGKACYLWPVQSTHPAGRRGEEQRGRRGEMGVISLRLKDRELKRIETLIKETEEGSLSRRAGADRPRLGVSDDQAI